MHIQRIPQAVLYSPDRIGMPIITVVSLWKRSGVLDQSLSVARQLDLCVCMHPNLLGSCSIAEGLAVELESVLCSTLHT